MFNVKNSTAPADGGGLVARLKAGLARTRAGLAGVFSDKPVLDAATLESIETALLQADVGVDATEQMLDHLRAEARRQPPGDIRALLQAEMRRILAPVSQPLQLRDDAKPFSILLVGVNGVGKTTTIGKLAKQLQLAGHRVMLAAGDTFRAAAVEQLQVWGERNDVPVIAQATGADSAAVIFDAMQAARARQMDVLLADTAGRLHTKSNLMEELKKVKRGMARVDPGAPHEILLVLDAGTGQNALQQAEQFHAAVGVTGIVLTKLDGTAKGGIVLAIAQKLRIPIRYIGVGEGVDDLRPFSAEEFIQALLGDST
jgi:fused signal recognition particle receptor